MTDSSSLNSIKFKLTVLNLWQDDNMSKDRNCDTSAKTCWEICDFGDVNKKHSSCLNRCPDEKVSVWCVHWELLYSFISLFRKTAIQTKAGLQVWEHWPVVFTGYCLFHSAVGKRWCICGESDEGTSLTAPHLCCRPQATSDLQDRHKTRCSRCNILLLTPLQGDCTSLTDVLFCSTDMPKCKRRSAYET